MRHLIRGPWWHSTDTVKIQNLLTPKYKQNDASNINVLREEMVTIPEVLMKLYYDYENERAIPKFLKKKVKPVLYKI